MRLGRNWGSKKNRFFVCRVRPKRGRQEGGVCSQTGRSFRSRKDQASDGQREKLWRRSKSNLTKKTKQKDEARREGKKLRTRFTSLNRGIGYKDDN